MRLAERRIWLGVSIAVAVALAFVVWLAVGRNNKSSSSHLGPVIANASELAKFAEGIKTPVYWAGPQQGFTYELTQTTAGKVYVRYLPDGVKVGDPRASFLIIATYPYPNAFSALENVSKGKGVALRGGGLALVDTGYRKSVHVAFPGMAYQIEVYDPSPARAKQVAFSGNVKPVR